MGGHCAYTKTAPVLTKYMMSQVITPRVLYARVSLLNTSDTYCFVDLLSDAGKLHP